MMKSYATGLKGFPYVIFMMMLEINSHPEMLILERTTALFNMFAPIAGKYGNGEKKEDIEELGTVFGEIRDEFHHVESSDEILWSNDYQNHMRKWLDTVEIKLYRLIADLQIIDAVTMGDGQYPSED